jgi:hypothetical protein
VFQSRIPDVFMWVLRFGFGYYYGGTDEEVMADRGQSLNRDQTYLMAVLPQVRAPAAPKPSTLNPTPY